MTQLAVAETDRLYLSGRCARQDNQGINACPYGMCDLQRRHWWLAGWHDEDMGRAECKVK